MAAADRCGGTWRSSTEPSTSLGGVLRLLPMGVFRASVDGRLLAANPAFLELAGLDPLGPVPGVAMSDVLRDEPGDGYVGTPTEGGTRFRPRVNLALPGGSVRRVCVTEVLSSDEQGHPVLDGLVEDLGERRSIEERLDVLQRFETIGRMTGSIAHDVNNMITAIIGYAALLDQGLAEGDDRRRDVEGISSAAQRCSMLVGQLLDAGRRSDGAPRPVEVARLLTDLRGLLEGLVARRGRLVLRPHEQQAWVHVDPVQLEQVLLNLVANARDAIEQDGCITLAIRIEELTRRSGSLRPGSHVILEVIDDGAGMTPEVAGRVFEPFFTTKGDRGTGLGLSSVRSILERWGGDVRLSSRPGRGTRFELWLRRAAPPA